MNTSEFNECIIGRSQLLFLIEDEDGEIFGYYLNTKIEPKYNEIISTNSQSFLFNLQSNGRLEKPLKFEWTDIHFGWYKLFDSSNYRLISLCEINLMKEEEHSDSFCSQTENWINYENIPKALCGKTDPNTFLPHHFFLIHLSF